MATASKGIALSCARSFPSFNGSGFTIAGTTGTPVDISTNPPTPIAALPSPPAPPATYGFTSGQAINIDGWSVTLQGTPKSGDTVNIGNATDPQYAQKLSRAIASAAQRAQGAVGSASTAAHQAADTVAAALTRAVQRLSDGQT